MAAPAALAQMSLLGEAVEHAPVGIFVFDEWGNYVAANEYGCALLGYGREELLSRRAELPSHLPAGTLEVQRKDGTELVLRFRARETKVAGMSFSVAVAWPDDG